MAALPHLHPLTGRPIMPVGFRNPRPHLGEVGPQPFFPIMGGDPTNDDGGGGDDAAAKAAADAKAKEDADAAAAAEAAKKAGKGDDGKTDEERGYPLNTPEADMTVEQKLAYRTVQMRKHEDALKKLAGKDMTPEKIAALLKAQEDAAEAAKTELERAVDAARKEGRESALVEASSTMVNSLIASHVEAAKLDKTKDAETIETLEALNHKSFIADDNTIDAAKLTRTLNRIAPIGGKGNPAWPATGQGNQNTGSGSAKDAGHAEAVRRGYREPDQVGS